MQTILFILGGGIGNILQALSTIRLLSMKGFVIDLRLHHGDAEELSIILAMPEVRQIFFEQDPKLKYDIQLNGPFTPVRRLKSRRQLRSRIPLSAGWPESDVYLDLARQLGVTDDPPSPRLAFSRDSTNQSNLVALYPGCKPEWAMKRWHRYDELAMRFQNVVVVGTSADFGKGSEPLWKGSPWQWPPHVRFMEGRLSEVATFLSSCDLFIGNDGGLAHIAALLKVPSFILYGPSSSTKNRPLLSNAFAVSAAPACSPCQYLRGRDGRAIFAPHRRSCENDMRCWHELTVEAVLNYVPESVKGGLDACHLVAK